MKTKKQKKSFGEIASKIVGTVWKGLSNAWKFITKPWQTMDAFDIALSFVLCGLGIFLIAVLLILVVYLFKILFL